MAKKTETDTVIEKVLDILTRPGVDSESEEGFDLIESVRDEIVQMGEKNE